MSGGVHQVRGSCIESAGYDGQSDPGRDLIRHHQRSAAQGQPARVRASRVTVYTRDTTQFAVFGVPLTPPHDQPAACWGSASHSVNQTIDSSSLPSQRRIHAPSPKLRPSRSWPAGVTASRAGRPSVVNPGRATRSSDGAGSLSAAAAALVLHASPSPPGPPSYPKQRLLSNSVQSIYYSGLCILRIIQTLLPSVLLASQLAVLIVPKISPDSAAAGVPRLYTGYAIVTSIEVTTKRDPCSTGVRLASDLGNVCARILACHYLALRSGKLTVSDAVLLYQGIPPVSRELPRGRVIRSGTFHKGLENGSLIRESVASVRHLLLAFRQSTF